MGQAYQPQKNNASNLRPLAIKKLGSKELKISWNDGHESVYSFRFLRQSCPCALCVDEWSGKPLLARESVSESLEGLKVDIVGQYALSVVFSDGHSTGLYTFQALRQICPCAACAGKEPSEEPKTYMDKQDLRKRPED